MADSCVGPAAGKCCSCSQPRGRGDRPGDPSKPPAGFSVLHLYACCSRTPCTAGLAWRAGFAWEAVAHPSHVAWSLGLLLRFHLPHPFPLQTSQPLFLCLHPHLVSRRCGPAKGRGRDGAVSSRCIKVALRHGPAIYHRWGRDQADGVPR